MDSENARCIMALYYAYGRNDAVAGTLGEVYVSPMEFVEHYRGLYAALESGASSFCPSVQDAWADYMKRQVAS